MTDIGTPVMPGPAASQELPRLARVLAVCAHHDDESSGLGAVLAALAGAGTSSSVLCFTHGEVSTLGLGAGDLRRVRADELAAAAAALGTGSTGLLDLTITVDRAAQLEAIACHASQSTHNRVLWHRLELLGNTEHLRYLRKTPV